VTGSSATAEQVALEIIEEAKIIIAEELSRGLTVTWKADNTPVTQIDTRINALAISKISEQFPSDAVYAEEGNGGAGTSGCTWVIDPIDGTRALELGLPTYTVCIARVNPEGQPDFSFVFNPSTKELYTARLGEKATKNGEDLRVMESAVDLVGKRVYVNSRLPIAAMQADDLCEKLTSAGAERVTTHSLAFGALLVAEGVFVAAVAGASEPYELASVKPIIEGAGGIVSDLEGNSIERCDTKLNGFIVAANETVLHEIIRLYQDNETSDPGQVEPMDIIRAYAPDAHDIQPVKSGYVNDVYIVDEKYVFRFPKNANSKKILLFEVEVLRRLQGHVRQAIPVVQHIEPNGDWAVFSYIKGQHYDSQDIRSMSMEAKRDFATNIAGFLFDINQAVSREWMRDQIGALPINRKDDAAYYEELLELGRKNENSHFEQYNTAYNSLMAVSDIVFSSEEIVIHGDLHSGNFIFTEDDTLAGIFDFGDCMLNTVYFELRQIYQFGDDILAMTVEALGGRFGSISTEAVRFLAVAHEFSILMRLGSSEEMPYDKDRGAIAMKLLQRWGEL